MDIKGDRLEMYYHPDGNLLVVTGDLAQLQMDKIYLIGPEVYIDQATNKAWVNGIGAMRMEESNTTFSGDKMQKTVPMTVHWNQSMLFHGNFAEFPRRHSGGAGENAHLACQSAHGVLRSSHLAQTGRQERMRSRPRWNTWCAIRAVRIDEERRWKAIRW